MERRGAPAPDDSDPRALTGSLTSAMPAGVGPAPGQCAQLPPCVGAAGHAFMLHPAQTEAVCIRCGLIRGPRPPVDRMPMGIVDRCVQWACLWHEGNFWRNEIEWRLRYLAIVGDHWFVETSEELPRSISQRPRRCQERQFWRNEINWQLRDLGIVPRFVERILSRHHASAHLRRQRRFWRNEAESQLRDYRQELQRLIASWDQSPSPTQDLQLMRQSNELLCKGPFNDPDASDPTTLVSAFNQANGRGRDEVMPWTADSLTSLHPRIDPWTPQLVHRLTKILDELGWAYTIIDSDQPDKRLGIGLQDWDEVKSALIERGTYFGDWTDEDQWTEPAQRTEPAHMLIIGERNDLPSTEFDKLWRKFAYDGRGRGEFLAIDAALQPAIEERITQHSPGQPSGAEPGHCVFPPSGFLHAELTRMTPARSRRLADIALIFDQCHKHYETISLIHLLQRGTRTAKTLSLGINNLYQVTAEAFLDDPNR